MYTNTLRQMLFTHTLPRLCDYALREKRVKEDSDHLGVCHCQDFKFFTDYVLFYSVLFNM